MGITGIEIAQNTYAASIFANTPERVAETPLKPAAPHIDTVRISQEAKNLSMNPPDPTINAHAEIAQESSDQDLPLEAYALPKWYAELHSDLTLLDDEIGIPYAQSRAARYDALSSKEKDDLAEYHGKLHTYFQEGLREHGIESSMDYYAQIVQDPAKSEEVHQAVKQKLQSDARAMQLMEHFGISV